MTFETERYRRKAVIVHAVRVTSDNMEELAEWCRGPIKKTRNGAKYIKVDVLNPIEPKQSKAFVGDYLLKSDTGWKVYTERGFKRAFELDT